jgi:hypothetical protein
MTRFVDAIIAYRILRKLTTPFEETDAFKLGIIDRRGKILRKFSELNSADERDAYTLLDRLVWRVKRIIERVPFESSKLASFAAALALIKENLDNNINPLPSEFEAHLLMLKEEAIQGWAMDITEQYFAGMNYDGAAVRSFKIHLEDAGGGFAAQPPAVANSVGAGFTSQANPAGNKNLAGRDILLTKRLARRKKPNV